MDQGPRWGTRSAQLGACGLAALASSCAALGFDVAAALAGAALMAVLLVLSRSPSDARPSDGSDEVLRVHLARARRRNEPTDLLVVQVKEAEHALARRLRSALRVTDSSHIIRGKRCCELHAMVDRRGLDRAALNARLSELAGRELDIGWAGFPEDGFTVGALGAQAHAAIGAGPSRTSASRAERFVAPIAAAQAQGAGK